MASQPRKGRDPAFSPGKPASLQWGRGFAATEGFGVGQMSGGNVQLQWGRGFAATEGCCVALPVAPLGVLQWGRGFAATEGDRPAIGADLLIQASMGPWLRSHGRAALRRRALPREQGFNGAVASQPRKENVGK